MTRVSSSNTEPYDVQSDAISWRHVRQIAFSLLLLSLFAIKPALAQNDVICDAEQLSGMIAGFFRITTAIGIVGLVIVWQVDSLAEMFTMNPDQKKGLKRHKRTALKSIAALLALGPLYTVAGSAMGLPLAECVDLVPW